MSILYRSQKLCLFWYATKPLIRLDTMRSASSYGFMDMVDKICKLKFDKLKPCLSNSSKKYSRLVSNTSSLLMNERTHIMSRQTRTLPFSHSQGMKDNTMHRAQTRNFSKSSRTTCKSTNDESSDVANKNNPTKMEETEGVVPEWTHPSSREDYVVKNDPELKSILHDLASDFEEDKSSKPDHEKTVDQDVETAESSRHHTGDGVVSARNNVADEEIVEPRGRKTQVDSARKVNGLLSLADIIQILREDNAQDICVIKVPKELQYVDYFVVVTGRSTRHLKAMTTYLNKVYKMLRKGSEPFMKIEGRNSDDWRCIDFGDIVVHFMLPETRELYELEMLWTLGPKYDDQYHRISQYQANVLNPTMPTQNELDELVADASQQEGYSVVILNEGENEVEIPDDQKI
ncbi:uncharacterized protein [Amphiura filiformis]|uniref:uncharacterized protein n=1 Tax=Amphiura filiformis TaxID=82378 RepID=UPI003B2238E7